jgi:hypothetical protein
LISSIINLICPQCRAAMAEFQCGGKCRRNWRAEWEWGNRLTAYSAESGERERGGARGLR